MEIKLLAFLALGFLGVAAVWFIRKGAIDGERLDAAQEAIDRMKVREDIENENAQLDDDDRVAALRERLR